MYVNGGTVALDSVTIESLAHLAVEGDAIYFEAGSLEASGLDLAGRVSGASVAGLTCLSPCNAGEWGSCALANGSTACATNCACSQCPTGKASSTSKATTLSVCEDCAAGRAAMEAGSLSCTACEVGYFATENSTDVGGGLVHQVIAGAKHCNPCPAGTFADTPSTYVCQVSTSTAITCSSQLQASLNNVNYHFHVCVATRS